MLQDNPDNPSATAISADIQRLIDARHHEPFALLGKHNYTNSDLVRAFIPGAAWVRIAENGATMQRMANTDLFAWHGPANQVPDRYRLIWKDRHGAEHVAYDPYCFPPQISEFDLHLFAEGSHWNIYRILGAHKAQVDGVRGVRFAVWAPSAERVSVVGDFNSWDGRCHSMQVRGSSGVWEIFMPGLGVGQPYKYEIRTRDHGLVILKTDPYGQHFEMRPATASRVPAQHPYQWQDAGWMQQRHHSNWLKEPLSIYEVHLGSWKRDEQGQFLNYRQLATELVNHVSATGFTHIELLPVTEHPLDASWGYQTTGYFAPTSRFGEPDDFRFFVDCCHQHNIGVILDWVPAHFPRDAHGLANFDGSALYEHSDPRRGEHSDWGTLIYNFGRNEVKNFLISSAVYWLEEFHLDGLRVDAVASMLYHDYSRKAGEWLPNVYGGRENLEAVAFLRELNTITHAEFPGTMVIAEESTAWPGVSRPVETGGLGFSMKWNMGWMHDSLRYMSHEPVHRQYHHNDLTFGLLYAFTENFVLPFSHDEVVHGKRSMLYKQPGDEWQQFANLRLLYTYMFTFPGKKLLFMGNEIAQGREWNFDASVEWYLLEYAGHKGMLTLVSDLNRLYRDNPELHRADFAYDGFEWLDSNASETSVLSYLRRDGDSFVIVVLNFTPVPRYGYRVGVPVEGNYRELLNSDSSYYAGTDVGNSGQITTEAVAYNGHHHSLLLTLPPLAGIVLKIQHD
jgi:1,4-alpha-glucan branching enzyme